MYETPQKIIKDIGAENSAALIISEVNRRYVSGFHSSEGLVFITNKQAYLLVDSRYYKAAKHKKIGLEVLLSDSNDETLKTLCMKHNIREVFIESDKVSVKQARKLKRKFEEISVELIKDDRLSEKLCSLRAIKTGFEINKMASSQQITDAAFSHIISIMKPGMTEREISLELEVFMLKQGAEKLAFDLIVVSGENTALPHGRPSSRTIKSGDLVTMDIGAVFDGYYSDMTRTVAVGSISSEKEYIYKTVLKAHNAALEQVAQGKSCSLIDKCARDVIKESGFGNFFSHSTGHGVGLEVHESPYVSSKSDTILESGMVITIEPGIYIDNAEKYFGAKASNFGVRIEDMIVVTRNGYNDFTCSDKSLLVI